MSFKNASSGRDAAKTIPISRDEFLETIFLSTQGEVCICTFKPGVIQRRWEPGIDYGDDVFPTYFNISTVKPPAKPDYPGKLERTKEACVETPIVYLDDIGTKVPVDKITLAPSYRLETSPGNHHFGYMINPPAKPEEAAALLRLLSDKGLTDHGVTGQTRIGRLPGSVNLKHPGWRATMREWRPDRLWTVSGLAAAFGFSEAEFAEAIAVERGEHQAAMARRGDPNDPPKPEFLALEEANMILSPAGSGKDLERAWLIRCPGADPSGWDADTPGHTPGHSDDDTAKVWETGGFKCHHGSCAERNFDDLCQWVAEHPDAGPVLDKIKREKSSPFDKVDGADSEPPPTIFDPAVDGPNRGAHPAPGGTPLFQEMGEHVVEDMPPEVCSFAVRGQVSMLVSAPGEGKSQLALLLGQAMVMDPASEPHKLIGDDKPFYHPGDVIVVQNEDAPGDTRNRRQATMRMNDLSYAAQRHKLWLNTHNVKAVVREDGNRGAPQLSDDLRSFSDHIRGVRRAGGDVATVIIDTAATAIAVDENDNAATHQAYSLLGEWARQMDVAVLVLHHTNKTSWRDGRLDMAAVRGATAISAAARRVFMLRRLSGEATDDGIARIELVLVKTNGSNLDLFKSRYFKMISVDVNVRDPRTPDKAATWSYPALKFDPIGPRLAPDDDVLLNACALVAEAEDDGDPLFAAVTGPSPRRAVKVLAETAGSKHKGTVLLDALLTRGWIEKDVVRTKGHGREVWRATPGGREVIEARRTALDESGLNGLAETATPAADRADTMTNVVPLPTPVKPKARKAKAPAAGASKAAGPSDLAGIVDIDDAFAALDAMEVQAA